MHMLPQLAFGQGRGNLPGNGVIEGVHVDDVVDVLQDILSELQELNRNLVDETREIGEKLEQISDGLFYLNLHLDAEVTPWTGGAKTSAPAPTPPASGLYAGTVKWYDTNKGYGFIAPSDGSADVFVYYSELPPPGYLQQGQRVAYTVRQGEHGPMAALVRFV